MAEETIVLNGMNGATGEYYTHPMTESEAVAFITEHPEGPETLNVLRNLHQQATQPHLGLAFDRDPKNPKEAGWAIVFHKDEGDDVRKALQPLIAHRQKQIDDDRIVRVLDYQDGETVPRWLARHRVAPGSVDPQRVPLYVLLVGSPRKIPFEFGHILDVEYCIGRLDFESPEDYAKYAESVVAYETGDTVRNRREVVFWGPRHINDAPTRLSSEILVKPLAQGQPDKPSLMYRISDRTRTQWRTRYFGPAESTKANLASVLGPGSGDPSAALLFTASHGLGWPDGHPNQLNATGALLCQDFPGAGLGTIQPQHYFSASDLEDSAQVHGMVAFHFACFGAGTPQHDRFLHKPGTAPPQIAPWPFFSPLPKALLAHRNGGALGVIGHVERAWMSSIATVGAGPQMIPFENVIGFILLGLPLGYALKDFNERYAALSTNLGALLEKRDFGVAVPDSELAARWTERNDAESYTLFGDPGVRVRIDKLES